MAEYWKSLPRKFCDICKCWFADNKASIDFHERGKRHKENAQKRIQDIQKRGIKEFKKQQQLENDMEKIEKAALAAYKKDLQNMHGENKSQSTVQSANNKSFHGISKPVVSSLIKDVQTKDAITIKKALDAITIKKEVDVITIKKEVLDEEPALQKLWYEGETDEGYKYYWNSETSESQWEPPEEGFISIEEQNQVNQEETVAEEEQQKSSESEESIAIKKEKEDSEDNSCSIGPQPKVDPYGQWITVEKEEPVEYDFQLPKPSENVVEVVIPIYKDETSLKFKEKVIGQLSDSDCANVTFKKRKFTGSLKKNARQRVVDDD